MKDEIKILAGAALLMGIVAGVLFLRGGDAPSFSGDASDQFQNLRLSEDLSAIALTDEERQALDAQGINFSSEEDMQATTLLRVQNSDELFTIDADLTDTDLSGMDGESTEIVQDLKGL